MSFFKRFKKSRRPSKQPASLGIPTNIAAGALGFRADLDLNAGPGGENNERGSRIVLRDSGELQRPRSSGPSTPTRREGDIKPAHELHERKESSDVSREQFSPGFFSTAEGGSGGRDPQQRKGRGTDTERPREVLAEPASENNLIGKDAPATAQSRRPGVAEGNKEDESIGNSSPPVDEKNTSGFCSLKNVLSTVSANYKEIVTIRSKVGGLLPRITALEEHFCSLPPDVAELRRRDVVIRALEGIKEELVVISERSSAVGYKENDVDVHAVCELAVNVRGAIMEYQSAQQKALYEHDCRSIDPDERTVLNSCRRARGAGYQHGNRDGCLKGTREGVLDEIERWTEDSTRSPIFWLNGLAGTGKTTIAQTIAERTFAGGRLGASFFCSRDFEDRCDLHFIFPTLAFQLAYKYPGFRSHFVSLLRTNPDIVYESLYNQMEKLIAEPLKATGVSTVIVIDAIDECKDDEPSSAILSVLGRFVGEISNAKFFITGRPEPRIKTGFRLPLLIDLTNVFVLHDVHPSFVNSDMRLFLKHELSELARRRQLKGWPTEESIDVLCSRAAGLFVYAVATIKFLDSNIHLPNHRLDAILQLPECTAPEGKTRYSPKTTLDSLYASILQTAFSEEDRAVDFKVRAIIGTIVVAINPLPPRAIAELVGVELGEVALFLTWTQSLLATGEDSDQPVKPFHKSFPDFITDSSRCTNPRFFISPGNLHLELALNCLRVMNDGLQQNLLSLPEYALNSEVQDLQTRIDDRISIALQYACRSWHSHLIEIKEDITTVIDPLWKFLREKFLAWLEVLSVLGDVGGAAVALEKLVAWLQKVVEDEKLLDTARDCFYFVAKFFEPISASATHTYHSALELCPLTSIVRESYYHQTSRIAHLPRVVIGTPDSWDPTISISSKDDYEFCTWSPSGRFVAALTGNAVEIRNQLTFELLTTLRPTETARRFTGPLTYSHDGRSIACGFETAIMIWDIQTGGVVKEIPCSPNKVSLVWSSDGRVIGAVNYQPQDTSNTGTNVNTYDVASGTPLFTGKIHSDSKPELWAHEESFRIMTTKRYFPDPTEPVQIDVKVSEVRSYPIEVHAFHITTAIKDTNYTPGSEVFSFSPTTSCVSAFVGLTLRVFQASNAVPLLQERGLFLSQCFSSDGRLFAAFKEDDVCIWEYTSGRYTRWRKFWCPDRINSPQFSPIPSSILSYSKNILQVWRLDNPPTNPKSSAQQHTALSPSGSHLATTLGPGSIVVIGDPHVQSPSQLIDTSVEIERLFLTSKVLLVVGSGQVVAWLLTAEGLVSGTFDDGIVNYNDRIWAVPLTSSNQTDGNLAVLSPTHKSKLALHVDEQIGAIEHDGVHLCLYNIETGEVIQSAQTPLRLSNPGYDPRDRLCGRHYLHYHNLSERSTPPTGCWYPSETALREGWIKDPEGRHRLWLHVEWSRSWDVADWCHDITTYFSILGDQSIVIKF